MKTVDVIIPLYNGGKWIEETLKSVLLQTYRPNKIFVVDDGSKDNSKDVVSDIPGIILLENTTDIHGHNAARNIALQYSDSDFIAFIDHDDLWHPRHLELLLMGFERYPEAEGALSGYSEFWEGQEPYYDVNDTGCGLADPWKLFPSISVDATTGALMFRREPFMKHGGWPVEHKEPSDYSCWMRATMNYPGIRIKARTLAYRRFNDSMLSKIEKQPLKWMGMWLFVGEDLINIRLTQKLDLKQELFLRRRILGYYKAYLWMASMLAGDTNMLRYTLEEIDHSLIGEHTDYVNAFWNDLHYTLLRSSVDEQEYIERLKFMVVNCTYRTPILYRLLGEKITKQKVGNNFYMRHVLMQPWDRRRWSLLAQAYFTK